jgi:hypothetical protein
MRALLVASILGLFACSSTTRGSGSGNGGGSGGSLSSGGSGNDSGAAASGGNSASGGSASASGGSANGGSGSGVAGGAGTQSLNACEGVDPEAFYPQMDGSFANLWYITYSDCGVSCSGEPQGEQHIACMNGCLQIGVEGRVDSSCTECFARLVDCSRSCPDCAEDAYSPQCFDCRCAQDCWPQFTTCSGFETSC